MSGPYRFVEHPAGVWRIEQKGWFFWSDVVICDGDSLAIRLLLLPAPGTIAPRGKRKFATLEAAKDALTVALANQAVRNIVPFDRDRFDIIDMPDGKVGVGHKPYHPGALNPVFPNMAEADAYIARGEAK